MAADRPLTALGLMSGTSLDGIDAALVETDGERVLSLGPSATYVYDEPFRDRLRAVLGTDSGGDEVARELTLKHAEAVKSLLADYGQPIDVVGFHGHTVLHRPAEGLSRQIGDGALLARECGLPVVADFRRRDIAAGGEGAPLAPLFHAALAEDIDKPLAVLNLGGVANVTWIGDHVLAFDTGPGNALLDDWARSAAGLAFDEGGRLAASGRVDAAALRVLLGDPFFARRPPKSLDRDHFARALEMVAAKSAGDGAATLAAFTAGAAARAAEWFPRPVKRWLVCGGGRRNRVLMAMLGERLEAPVAPAEAVSWDGDALEAQAFAFLAVRSLRGLPLSLPTTTGVARPTTGGTRYEP